MFHYFAQEGKIIFSIVRKAFSNARVYLKAENPEASLIWYDTLREIDYFSTLKPWQVVNRIPNINTICRKTHLTRLMQRMNMFYPSLYNFYPKSFVLPNEKSRFTEAVNLHDQKYIIKPDGGSLGFGITIINENDEYTPTDSLCVAQEYLESALIDDTKFDLRVYVLVASVNPLTIYIFRDGVARFCSMKNEYNTIYSQLTNTAINKKNVGVDLAKITQMIDDVFKRLKSEGINTDLIWKKIDNLCILTVISVLKYIEDGTSQQCPDCGYNRCFQILGFDIIFDKEWNPYLLEVNYRPSLESCTDQERAMKLKMLSEAISLGAPLDYVQPLVNSELAKSCTKEEWKEIFDKSGKKIDVARNLEENAAKVEGFVKIFPTYDSNNQKIYDQVINMVRRMPNSQYGKLPCLLKMPKMLPKVGEIKFDSIHPAEKVPPSLLKQNKKTTIIPVVGAQKLVKTQITGSKKIITPIHSKKLILH